MVQEVALWSPFPIVGWMPCPALMQVGRGLVLPQLHVSGLVDFPQEVLPFRRIGWELVEGDVEVSGKRGERGNCGWDVK